MKLATKDVLDFLKQIETGEVQLSAEVDPQDVYAGNVHYAASNGWKIVIFNDCNEWDYVDRVESSDGRAWNFGDDDDEGEPISHGYDVSNEVAWERYGIPGYLKSREPRFTERSRG